MTGYFRVLFFASLLVSLPCFLVRLGPGPRRLVRCRAELSGQLASTHSYKQDICTCMKYP
jgi:hypothetical protein